ncbi:MAG: GNAT family protein [Pseudomonadota bacterium]
MALLDFTSDAASPTLIADAVVLRRPRNAHFEAWRALRERSRDHLTRWEPDWTEEEASQTVFKEKIKAYHRAARRGVAAPFFIFLREDDTLIGGANLLNIMRGASQSAALGYWVGEDHTRRGYGTSAVRAVLDFAFSTLGLNRVEAACQPENAASRALLGGLGFREEGCARHYLHINGAWRDHLIFAMIAADWRERSLMLR